MDGRKIRNHSHPTAYTEEPAEEKILSQKFTQLSISTNNEEPPTFEDITDEIQKIPDFLTKRNKSFKQMIRQVISTATIEISNKTKEELRQIAILIYKIMFVQTNYSLWTTYLKSGMGQLIIPLAEKFNFPTNLHIWPKAIKILMQKSTKINTINENEICMNLVNIKLIELDNQLKQYQAELNKIRNGFYGYILQHQHLIERYIEQNMSSLRREIEHKIELIHYDYHIQAFKLQYLRHNPNNYQKQLLKQLCRSKYEQEMTEQELIFLQQQITYFNSPSQSFENSSIAQSTIINSLENPEIRQQLLNQYKAIAENSKHQLSALCIKAAEEQRDKYKKQHDNNVKQMWSDRHAAADHEKIPLFMIDLINERCKKIGESIQSIYKFKVQCFLSKSNLIHISHMDLNMSHAPEDIGQPTNQGQQRKKRHGNRKDQRFRKKCRARGMKPENIEILLHRHKEIHNKKMNHDNKTMRNTTDENVASTTTTTAKNISNRTNEPSVQRNSTPNINKRKRDVSLQQLSSNPTIPKSTSSLSIVQPSSKKMKKKKKTTTSSRPMKCSNNNTKTNYRSPKYLKRSPSVIIKMLSKTLNYTFKENNEKKFICVRLNLLDQCYFLRLEQELWNSYLDVGIQRHLWP
ncbi:unnamed protein product, partial [Rotaria sp. Silwood2]